MGVIQIENDLYDIIFDVDNVGTNVMAYLKKGTFDKTLIRKSRYGDMGVLHRLDGPALSCGDEYSYWYIDGVAMSEEKARLLKIWNDKQNKP